MVNQTIQTGKGDIQNQIFIGQNNNLFRYSKQHKTFSKWHSLDDIVRGLPSHQKGISIKDAQEQFKRKLTEEEMQAVKSSGKRKKKAQLEIVTNKGEVLPQKVIGEEIEQLSDFSKRSEEELELLKTLQSVMIDIEQDLPKPPVCLKIDDTVFGTLGNFSCVIGKAKSRKTFFVSMLVAAALKKSIVLNLFQGCLPKGKRTILYFDTEQADYHFQRVVKRILRLAGLQSLVDFKPFALRKFNPAQRKKLIELAISITDNLGLVIIDGIRDIVTSINDEEQATSITSDLLRWTTEYNIHIITVLHQNKGDGHARGHLGTEVQNKAETVLSVTKDSNDNDLSIVQAEYCRDKEPEKFAFGIDENGLPFIEKDWREEKPKRKEKPSPKNFSKLQQTELLNTIFSKNDKYKFRELQSLIKIEIGVGESKARDFITYFLSEKLITRVGKERSVNSYYVQGDTSK